MKDLEAALSCGVDYMINYLRIQYDIVIYNKMPPFVDPMTKEIIFCYAAKWCNRRDGWNGRVMIGESSYTSNVQQAKLEAIHLAMKWLDENKKR